MQAKKLSNATKFFLSVIFLYAVIAVFNLNYAEDAFKNFLMMFIKIVPLLALVFAAMILVNLYFTEDRVKKYLGESSGIKGWLFAIISGILISGPPYVFYPLLEDLKKHGMSDSLLAVFLYNRNIVIPFIPAMIYYFGIKFSIILTIYMIIFSVFNGIIAGYVCEN